MRFQFVIAIGAVMLGIVVGFTPVDARIRTDRTSSEKPKASIAHSARPQPQSATPPIGYCLQCLPPPYEWPHGGAGP
jgi:hypothetical protein